LLSLTGSPGAFERIEVEATLDHEARTISGLAQLPLESPEKRLHGYHLTLFPAFLCERSDTADCGIRIDSVFVGAQDISEAARVNGTDVEISSAALSNAPVTNAGSLSVYFTTFIPETRGRFGFHNGQFTLHAWFPMPAPRSDSGWVVIEYEDNAEFVSEHYDIRLTLHVSDSLQIIAPGVVETTREDGDQTVIVSLTPAQDVPLVIGTGYQLDEVDCQGIALKTYCRPESMFAVETLRETACRTLSFMSAHVSSYPFDELVLVIGGMSGLGGLELPRMVLLSDPADALATRVNQTIMIHEVVHQWFYGLLASNQADEPWLDESITEYFTERINRHIADGRGDIFSHYGVVISERTLARLSSHRIADMLPVDRPSGEYTRGGYARAVYAKGTLVIMTLMGIMGDENVARFWPEYVSRFRYSRPTRSDFIQLATEYAPTDDTAKVAALISTVTPPDFALESVRTRIEESEADTLSDSTPAAESFEITVVYTAKHPPGFPVDFRMEFQDGTVLDTLVNPHSGRHELMFHHTARPVCASIDPDYRYAIDINFLNNSLQYTGGEGSGPRLFSGVLFLVESLFSTLWGL
jgi:hypothetical protein